MLNKHYKKLLLVAVLIIPTNLAFADHYTVTYSGNENTLYTDNCTDHSGNVTGLSASYYICAQPETFNGTTAVYDLYYSTNPANSLEQQETILAPSWQTLNTTGVHTSEPTPTGSLTETAITTSVASTTETVKNILTENLFGIILILGGLISLALIIKLIKRYIGRKP